MGDPTNTITHIHMNCPIGFTVFRLTIVTMYNIMDTLMHQYV